MTAHSPHRIALSSKAYVRRLAQRLPKPLADYPAYDVPCTGEILKAYEEAVARTAPLGAAAQSAYASDVGAAIYAGPATRFDALYGIGMCARCITFPTERMQRCIHRIIAYMAQTENAGVVYDASGPDPLLYEVYSDSDWSETHSTTGVVHLIGGKVIQATSKRQQSIALSSTEAEIMAASMAGAEAMHMRGLLGEMGYDMSEPTVVWVDNSGAVELAKRRESAQRSRHIERRYLKIREWVAEGHLVVKYKNTADNRADMFTKPLVAEDFCRHRDAIMSADTSMPEHVSGGGVAVGGSMSPVHVGTATHSRSPGPLVSVTTPVAVSRGDAWRP